MIFIRADANERIGTGHVMRCLSIAQALAEQGEETRFITADHCADELIHSRGFKTICLDSEWSEKDNEIGTLIAHVKQQNINTILVDSYCVSNYYFQELSPYVNIAYIDDLNTTSWKVDLLINYNVYAEDCNYSGYEETSTLLLLQPRYAPLRVQFKDLPAHSIKDEVTDVLVSAGGADPECIYERFICSVCPRWPEIIFHFLIGALNPNIEYIRKHIGNNVWLHINEMHIAELMEKCDIAVAAAGTTLYELCAVGVPTITYTLADNQVMAAAQFETKGIMLSAGDCRDDEGFVIRINNLLLQLMTNKNKRADLSERMQSLVDGNGAERIASLITQLDKEK